MKKRIKYIIALILLIFLPLSWDIRQPGLHYFGIGLFTSLGIIWLVIRSRKNDEFRIPKFFLPLLIFLGLQVILLIITPDRRSGVYWIIFEIYLFSFFIYVLDAIRSSGNQKFLENLLIGAGLVYAFIDLTYVLLWYASWWKINGSLLPLPPTTLRSPGVFLGYSYLLSSYLNIVILLVLVRLLHAKNRSGRVLWLEILVILILANFVTYSRAGWLALAGGITVTLLLYYSYAWESRTEILSRIQQTKIARYNYILLGLILVTLSGMVILVAWRLQSAPHGTLGARLDIYSYVIRWISSSPLWGQGTGATPYIFSHRYYAIGGDEVYQAHNLWLQTALESGLLGLSLFIVAVGFIIRANFSTWQKRKGNPDNRARMAAYIGVGVAVLIQSILDNMFWKAAYEVALIIIIALVYSLVQKKEYFSIRKLYIIPVIGIVLISSTIGLLYLERGMIPYWEGKTAAKGWDWEITRKKVCQAADQNPDNEFYSFQCSLAIAYHTEITDNLETLSDASSYLKQGLDNNPQWYAHWANLASYEWELGNQESAVGIMRETVNLAPNRTYLWLTLARMEEQLGNQDAALNAYLVSICQSPSLERSILFMDSKLFQEAALKNCPPSFNTFSYGEYQTLMDDGREAFDSGKMADAEILFQQAALSNTQSGLPIAYLALLLSETGRIQESDKELNTALFIDDQSVGVRLIAAKIAFSRGEEEQGFGYLTEAFSLLEQSSLSEKYYVFSYFDNGLPTDSPPSLPKVFLNYEQKEAFINLASHFKEIGNLELSRRVEQWLDRNLISLD